MPSNLLICRFYAFHAGADRHWDIWGTCPPPTVVRGGNAGSVRENWKIKGKMGGKWGKNRKNRRFAPYLTLKYLIFASKLSKFRKILEFYLDFSKKWRHVTSFLGSRDMKMTFILDYAPLRKVHGPRLILCMILNFLFFVLSKFVLHLFPGVDLFSEIFLINSVFFHIGSGAG